MSRGLVVGKFMPLHLGHQLVIEKALTETEDVTVVVYDNHLRDNPFSMPVEKRMKWIANLYPSIENIVPRKDFLEGHVSDKEKESPKYAQAYADDLAFLGHFDYVFSSEQYGEPFAQALGAKHIEVDYARIIEPISGTKIRANIFENREYVDPLVYRSLIQKVVFVGTESTGKTTLAKALAKEFKTQWVHEYGRELWEAQGGTGSFSDLLKIGLTQYAREESAALDSNKYLFCDTNAWTTLQWSLMYYGTADTRLYDLVARTKDEYIWYLCDNDFDWQDDGTRELNGDYSFRFQEQNIKALEDLGVKYKLLSGDLRTRINKVKINDVLSLFPRKHSADYSVI